MRPKCGKGTLLKRIQKIAIKLMSILYKDHSHLFKALNLPTLNYGQYRRFAGIYWAGEKMGPCRLMTIILSILTDLRNFFTGRFLGKFAVKWISAIPPHIAHVAALPCETLMSGNQAINEKLLGSVATYLTCGGVVNSQIKK